MKHQQKEAIRQLRQAGQSYAKIADLLGISENTVKSYCRRNELGGVSEGLSGSALATHCRHCGATVMQTPGKKARRYCSDKCRMLWWNAHPEAVTRKRLQIFTCKACGQIFEGYGKRDRKFCSRTCYGQARVVQA